MVDFATTARASETARRNGLMHGGFRIVP
ncbi:sulfurtransferase FdhD, partial [Pseudomonas sp. BGM005]|nr:sulfurtransferase FdhD [Pseudomonas sp. BG5]